MKKSWLKFLGKEDFTLMSPFPPAECRRRLETAMDIQPRRYGNELNIRQPPTIWGEVTLNSIVLSSGVSDRNPFKTYAVAKLSPMNGGSIIEGRLSIHPEMWKVVFLWCAIVVGFSIPVLLEVIRTLSFGGFTFKDFSAALQSPQAAHLIVAISPSAMYPVGRWASIELGFSLKRFLELNLDPHESIGQRGDSGQSTTSKGA